MADRCSVENENISQIYGNETVCCIKSMSCEWALRHQLKRYVSIIQPVTETFDATILFQLS